MTGMRNLFPILLTLSVFALFSCSQEYTVTGRIDGAVDGDSVIMGYSADGVDFTVTDRTVVENGEFHFGGKIKGSKIYYIGYEQSVEPEYMLFFLEGGDIQIIMSGEESTATGTASNDLNAEVEEKLSDYVTRMFGAEVMLASDTLMSDSAKADMYQRMYDAHRDVSQYIRDVIFHNEESIVSLYLLVQYSDLFSLEELEQAVDRIPSENVDRKNNCLYDILVEALNERKNNPGELPLLDFE